MLSDLGSPKSVGLPPEQPIRGHTLEKNYSLSLSDHQFPEASQLWVEAHEPLAHPIQSVHWHDLA